MSELTEPEKVVLYVLGTLEECRNKGFVTIDEPARLLTPNGWFQYLAMKGFGYRPPEREVFECLWQNGMRETGLVGLIVHYACKQPVEGESSG